MHVAIRPALSLSVEVDKDGYHSYASAGFEPVTQAHGPVTMRLRL